MHHCCNAVLEMVTELCPLFSHPSGLAEAVQEIHRLLPAFGIPDRRADAAWKGAGRAQVSWEGSCRAPSWQHLTQPVSDTLSLAYEAAGCSQGSRRGAGQSLPAPFSCLCVPTKRCLHPHEPAAAMQVQTTGVFYLSVFSHGPARNCYKREKLSHILHSVQPLSMVCCTAGAGCSCFQVKTKNTSTSTRGFISIPVPAPLQHSRGKCHPAWYSWRDRAFPAGSSPETHSALLG